MKRVSKFPDPNQLASVAPALILDAIARGYLALDRRALRALVERPNETVAAIAGFAKRDHSEDVVDLTPDTWWRSSGICGRRAAFHFWSIRFGWLRLRFPMT